MIPIINFIKIGTTQLPDPVSYTVSQSDIDGEETGRSETGVLHRNRVRAGTYKIEATWSVPETELKTVANLLAPESFKVTFFSPTTAATVQKTMYAGDKTASFIGYEDNISYWSFSVNLIEY